MSKTQPFTPKAKSGGAFARIAECLYRNVASGTYYALVKRSGKQFRRSLKTTDYALAKQRLVAFRQKVGRLSQRKGAKHLTFGELASRWLDTVRGNMKASSAERRANSIKQLKRIFGAKKIRSITAADCDVWIVKRGNLISASSFNNERDTLRLILEYAKRDGLILENPAMAIARRKMAKPKIIIPTQAQFRTLVGTMRKLDSRARPGADLVELLAYSGTRHREATSMLWGDVDLERGCFTVTGGETGTKNHEARTVPLFPALRIFLERISNGKTPSPKDRIVSIENAKEGIKKACRLAELPHFSHHTMRHYFVSNAIEAGVDFKVIAGWVGHKDGGVLVAKTYGHLRDAHSFDMAKRMTFSAQDEMPANVVSLKDASANP